MYGLKRDNIRFYIVNTIKFKKPCLFVEHENNAFKVGQFNDWQTAKDFMVILDYICYGNHEDEARGIIREWEK